MSQVREKLIRTAMRTVRYGGTGALNFRDLGKAVGVRSSSVHYYFPTKTDLLVVLAEADWRDRAIELSQLERTHNKSMKDSLRGLIGNLIASRSSGSPNLCSVLASEYGQLEPRVKREVDQYFFKLEKWILERTEEFSVKLICGLKPKVFVKFFMCTLEGGDILGSVPSQQMSLESLLEWIGEITELFKSETN